MQIACGLLLWPVCLVAQPRFLTPLSGNYGRDFIIVNYVDWGLDTFFNDNHCGTKTYDGHQGTDFVIRDFAAMDSGIIVRAVDNGRVNFVKDGLFDREKTSDKSKQLGNYIGISHSGHLQTYYGHLRKYSILVKPGDSVVAGQPIAKVGSSGNSESPHLHFELWYDSSYYIDPFAGPCGNVGTYWLSPPAYDTSFASWTSGMTHFVCSLDTLKEGLKSEDTFYAFDAAISYWNLQRGIRKGDSLKIEWFDPNGVLWFRYSYAAARDGWYYYYSSYINTPVTGLQGKWSLNYYRNNQLVDRRAFYFFTKPTSSAQEPEVSNHDWYARIVNGVLWYDTQGRKGRILLYNIQGKLVQSFACSGGGMEQGSVLLQPGLYLIVLEVRNPQGTLQACCRQLIQAY